MKKIIALLLCVIVSLSFVSCTRKDKNESDTTANKDTAQNETDKKDDTDAQTETDEADGEASADMTVGEAVYNDFKNNSSGTCTEIAERLLANETIAFMGGAVPVEEGYLAGFDDTEITGFKDGAMFAPMIGTIPFVGYIFEIEDESKIEEFKMTLKNSANLRWNICTTADEMICENEGNKVFFLMCPTQFEDSMEEGGEELLSNNKTIVK